MELYLTILAILTSLSIAAYCGMILLFTAGWLVLKEGPSHSTTNSETISIVVAVRNEAENIVKCLDCLIQQEYPSGLTEIIISDDGSTDETVSLVHAYIAENKSANISLLLSEPGHGSKKAALSRAIAVAAGSIILTTDADARPGKKWASSMAASYHERGSVLVFGPVRLNPACAAEKLEFLSLVASGAGASGAGFPFMGNGANLLFSKEAFVRAGGYQSHIKIRSGDDVFLIHDMVRIYGSKKVGFCMNADAVVETAGSKSISDFLMRRARWASKAPFYKNLTSKFVSLTVFSTSFFILCGFVSALFSPEFLIFPLGAMLIKAVSEFGLMAAVTAFMGSRKLLLLFIPLQLIYPIYIMLTVAAIFFRTEWKR